MDEKKEPTPEELATKEAAEKVEKEGDKITKDEPKKETKEKGEKGANEKDPNEGIDPLDKGSGMFLHLPTSSERAFMSKARLFKINGRLGKGKCLCLKKFMLPNGDLILKDDTFDAIEERFSIGRFRSLLARKFFSISKKDWAETEAELLEKSAKK